MKMIVLAALVAAAGCSKKTVDCGPIANGMDTVAKSVKARAAHLSTEVQDNMVGLVGQLKDKLIQRCTADQWSPEAVACFGAVTSQMTMKACEDKLPEEQRKKLRADIRMVTTTPPAMPQGLPGHPPVLLGSGGSAAPPAGSAEPAPAGSAAPASGDPAPAPAPAAAAAPAGSAVPAPAGGGAKN
jgi:hypothetical protein